MPATALAVPPAPTPADDGDWITTTLPVSAREAFARFTDLEALPEWLPVVASVKVRARNRAGLPVVAAFLARLERATIGYSLRYHYDADGLGLRWTTPRESGVRVTGRVRFSPLGPRASLMEYQLGLDRRGLPAWDDPFFDNHPPSAVLSHFRDYVDRTRG